MGLKRGGGLGWEGGVGAKKLSDWFTDIIVKMLSKIQAS